MIYNNLILFDNHKGWLNLKNDSNIKRTECM